MIPVGTRLYLNQKDKTSHLWHHVNSHPELLHGIEVTTSDAQFTYWKFISTNGRWHTDTKDLEREIKIGTVLQERKILHRSHLLEI